MAFHATRRPGGDAAGVFLAAGTADANLNRRIAFVSSRAPPADSDAVSNDEDEDDVIINALVDSIASARAAGTSFPRAFSKFVSESSTPIDAVADRIAASRRAFDRARGLVDTARRDGSRLARRDGSRLASRRRDVRMNEDSIRFVVTRWRPRAGEARARPRRARPRWTF